MSTVGQQLAVSRRPRADRNAMQPRMIRVADIERLQRTTESVPEQRVEESHDHASRPDAVLADPLHAGQGIRPTRHRGASQRQRPRRHGYHAQDLGEARAAGRRKNGRNAKTHRPVAARARATAPTTESKLAAEANAASGGCTTRSAGGGKAAPAVTTPPATAALAVAPKGTGRPSDDASARRSAFVPKEDPRDM